MWLFLNGRLLGDLRRREDGTWSVGGLPPGRYGVRAWGKAGNQSLGGQVFLEPGAVTDLELFPTER
jgi:hypothetical protein